MEEVWREISIPPSLDHTSDASRGMILQDFLAGPIMKEAAPPAASSAAPPPLLQLQQQHSFPLLPPTTALSLNTALCFPIDRQPSKGNNGGCGNRRHSFAPPPFMMGSPPPPPPPQRPAVGLFSFSSPTKSVLLDNSCSSDGGGFSDRRNKRMMKNRESAARSRARKQAYTNELELEVAHLLAENEKLRKQYQELSSAMAAQHSAKKTLQRTLTAPF